MFTGPLFKEYLNNIQQGSSSMVGEYLKLKDSLKDLETQKKQAAIEEDFETALMCKKQIGEANSNI